MILVLREKDFNVLEMELDFDVIGNSSKEQKACLEDKLRWNV